MSFIRAKALERVIVLAQEKFGYAHIDKPKVYLKNNYVFLDGQNSARHIVLNGKKIEVVNYSWDDIRNYASVDTNTFEYIDDFLLYLFRDRFDIASTFETARIKGENALREGSIVDFMAHKKAINDSLESRFLLFMVIQKFYLYQTLIAIKVRRKQYFLQFTHTATFLGYFFLILFWVLFALGNIQTYLLFIGGILFISSSYLQIELIYREYKAKQAISINNDRIYGAVALIGLLIYILYFYKII